MRLAVMVSPRHNPTPAPGSEAPAPGSEAPGSEAPGSEPQGRRAATQAAAAGGRAWSASGAATDESAPSTPAQLAHELNNLLDGSLRSVGLALRKLRESPQGEAQRDAVGRLESADRLMQRMIGLIGALGTEDWVGSAGNRAAAAAPQTLGEALEHAIESCAARAESRGITVAAVADPALVPHSADALFTVLSNALRNAIESIDERRRRDDDPHGLDRVELRLERDGDDAVISVADSGAGVDPSLTESGGGFRYGVTTKEGGNGIGLGLCRQVAQALGGRLWLRDQTPRGAVLTLRFPVEALRPMTAGSELPTTAP